MRRALGTGLLIGLCACSRDRGSPPEANPVSRLEVQLAGCSAVRSGPVCELGASRTVRMWVPAGHTPAVSFDVAGDAGAGPAVGVEGGSLITVQVPAGASAMTLESKSDRGIARSTVRVGDSSEPPWVQRAQALRRAGKLDDAEGEVARAVKKGPADEARAEGLLARIALVRGQVKESIGHFEAAIRKGAEAGLVSHQADDAMALSFALVQRSLSYSRAREVLEGIPELAASYPEGWARAPYYRGLLAGRTGDWRSALSLLRESRGRAARLGMGPLQRNADDAIANQLLDIGRTAEAVEVQRRLWALDTKDTPACDRAVLANNMAFALLSSPDGAGPAERKEAIALLGTALNLLEGGCPDPYRRANALTDLVLAMIQDGQLDSARAQLQRAKEALPTPTGTIASWWAEAEGRLAIAKRDGRSALRAFERTQELAVASDQLPQQWSAAVGRGMALELLGRDGDALKAYESADALLEKAAEMVPLGEGRALFVGDRTRGAMRRISLLIAKGRAAEAFETARQSRARVLRSLHLTHRVTRLGPEKTRAWEDAVADYRRQRDAMTSESAKDWQLPADQLAARRVQRAEAESKLRASMEKALAMIAPAGAGALPYWSAEAHPDVLLVGFHPVPEGWAVFAARGAELKAATVRVDPAQERSSLAVRLIEPIRGMIAAAKRIRFLPYGPLRSVDFHALPWEGAPLIAHAVIEYAVDLPQAAEAERGAGRALVVANPTLDLVAAEQEGERVAATFRGDSGGGVQLLKGRGATVAALQQALPGASFFHYAGHGEFRGTEGWESALPLADGTALWVSDLLALPASPSQVVLSACEGAKGSWKEPVETLSLGHAFVLAGSREVLAPTRAVKDEVASEVVRRLYEGRGAGGEVSLAEALQRAQTGLAASALPGDWQAFRVLTP